MIIYNLVFKYETSEDKKQKKPYEAFYHECQSAFFKSKILLPQISMFLQNSKKFIFLKK
jgi:hypothetical protein